MTVWQALKKMRSRLLQLGLSLMKLNSLLIEKIGVFQQIRIIACD
jgi:hypothetical protein